MVLSDLGIDILANNTHKIMAFLGWFLTWMVLFIVINYTCNFKGLSTKSLNDTKNRIISIIHGVVTFVWAAYLYLPYPPFNQPNTESQVMLILLSFGYVAYDLVACVYYKLADMGLLIHHSCCLIGFGSAYIAGYGAIDGIGGLFIAQVSNFPMHLRCIIRNFKLKYTKTYQLSQNLYFFLYIIFRGLFGPIYVLYPCLTAQKSPIAVKCVCSLLISQSFYYIYLMISLITKKINQSRQRKQKMIYYFWFQENPQIQKLSYYKKREQQKIF